jgi:hypothetical protein
MFFLQAGVFKHRVVGKGEVGSGAHLGSVAEKEDGEEVLDMVGNALGAAQFCLLFSFAHSSGIAIFALFSVFFISPTF